MAKKFDDDLFEDVPYEAQADMQDDLFEDVPYGTKEEPASKTESAIRGAAQGLTFDFADEGIAGIKALYDDFQNLMTNHEGAIQPQFDELGRITNTEEQNKDSNYGKYVEEERAKFDKAREDNPITYIGSEIGSGIIPALFTGGAAAAGKVGAEVLKIGAKQGAKELAKEGTESGMKAAIKEAAKIGAAQGTVTGLGTSEADLSTREGLGEALRDTAIGTTLGTGLGTVMPIAAKAVGKTLGKGKQFGSYLIDKAPSVKTGFQFGEKHGLASNKKINNLMEDNTRNLVRIIKKNLEELGIEKNIAEAEAAKLGKTYDVTGDIQEVVNNLRSKTKGLAPKDVEKANALISDMEEGFLRVDKKRQDLISRVEKDIAKKTEKSLNKATTAPLKAESKAVQEAEKRGLELEQLEDINKNFEDVAELPFDTKGGQISGQKAKFTDRYYDPATDSMVPFSTEKKYISDTTPFKPSEIAVDELDDKLVAKYTDESTGEVFSKEGPKSRFVEQDFSNMTVDDIAYLAKDYGNRVYEQGGDNVEIYKPIQKILRNKLSEIDDELPQNKEAFRKIYDMMEIFNIDKNRIGNPSTPDIERLVRTLPGKMDESKDIVLRNLVDEDSKLGEKIQDISDLTDAKKYLGDGYTSATGEFTKAGVAQKIFSGVSVPVGAIYGKAIKAPSKFVANNVNEMSDEALQFASKKLSESDNEGLKAMGRQLDAALSEEGPVRSALVWSLSQNPAFRQKVRSVLPEAVESVGDFLGVDLSNPVDDFIKPEQDNEPISMLRPEEQGRKPAGEVVGDVSTQDAAPEKEIAVDKEFMKELEGFESQGYVPSRNNKVLGNSGVTIANALDLGQRNNLDDLDLSPEIKNELIKYLGLKKEKAVEFLKDNPLDLDSDLDGNNISDVEDVAKATNLAYYDKVKKLYESKTGKPFEELPEPVRTALFSINFHTGSVGPKTLEKASNDNDYSDLIDELQNYYKEGSKADSDYRGERRRKEAQYLESNLKNESEDQFQAEPLEDLVDEVKKVLERQMKQQGSGDTTPEFHIERTLAAIDALPTDQINKDALEDEVVNAQTFADVERIKNLLDGLKNLN